MPGRVLGSDKIYVSSKEGSRDPRKGSWVAVQASWRRGVFAYNRPLVTTPTPTPPLRPFLAHFIIKSGKPLYFWTREKKGGSMKSWEKNTSLDSHSNQEKNPTLKLWRTWVLPQPTPPNVSVHPPKGYLYKKQGLHHQGTERATCSKQSWRWQPLVFLLGPQLEILEGNAFYPQYLKEETAISE